MVTQKRKIEPREDVIDAELADGNPDAWKQALGFGDIYDGRPLPGNGNGDPVLQGAELLAEAAAEPTMDRYLDGSPKLLTDKDWEEFVTVLQRKRALFITAEQKRKEPKIEGEDE